MSSNSIKRFLVPLRLALAGLFFVATLHVASADTFNGHLSYAPSPPSDFFGDIELITTGLTLSETGDSGCTAVRNIPFPLALPSDSRGCEGTGTFNLNATFSADGEPAGPLFLLSMIVQPQPSDEELLIVHPAASSAPPQQPFSMWLLVGVSSAIALIGGTRVFRVRRT